MQITIATSLRERIDADVLVFPFWQGKKEGELACSIKEREFLQLFEPALRSGDFLGKEGETLFLYRARDGEKRVLLLGLGMEKGASAESLRRAYSSAVKGCRHRKLSAINVVMPLSNFDEAVLEGLLLTNYAFDKHKEKGDDFKPLLEKICLVGLPKSAEKWCQKTEAIIRSVNFTRDLVNSNADDKSPQTLARLARDLEGDFKQVVTTVLEKKQLEKEKLGLLLAVGRGSYVEPALIVIEYKGNPSSKDRTALIGKGVIYDTGGLNIKPTGSMETMKCDMAGAAAVLGTIRAAATLRLKVNLVGVIPTTENAIGPNSYKPGDVYTSYSGKTVEIANTDAEGRLILADALSYTQAKLKATRMIDLATLTGAMVIALGEEMTGLFANSDSLASQLLKAGESVGERLWRLPLCPEYKETLKSPIADLKNSGGRSAGAGKAAMFLMQFVEKEVDWAHLDIAGTAYLSEPKGYNTTHATGVGVRLLIDYLEHLKK